MKLLSTIRRVPRRASILLFSTGMMAIAGTSVITWVGTVNDMQVTAARDRARIYALTAAEAGIEQVVDYFNNPANYTGALPQDVAADLEVSPYEEILQHNVHPQPYMFFEPYVLRYSRNGSGLPVDTNGEVIVDNQGNLIPGREPVVTNWTFLRDLGDLTSSRIPTMELDIEGNDNLIFLDENGRELARVTSIQLVNPLDIPALGDPMPDFDGNNRVICKVIATATTPRGVTTRVESILRENRFNTIMAPGALVSAAPANFDGQVNVFWGEIWTRADGILINNWTGPNGLPKTTDDPWFAYKTNGNLRNQAGLYLNGLSNLTVPFTLTPIAEGAVNYYQPLIELSNTISHRNRYTDRENLYQNQDLDFPNYDYYLVKEFFLSNGVPTHFQTPDGQIAGRETNPASPNYRQWVKKSFADWFSIDPSDPDYWNTEKMLTFIDTIPTDMNGNHAPLDSNGIPVRNATYRSRAPRPDGANYTTINAAGGGNHTRGAMFIYGNLDFAGQGNPPSYSDILDEDGNSYVVKPDGTVARNSDFQGGNNGIAHNGLMAVSGSVRNTGNRRFYGSIFAGFGLEEDISFTDGFDGSGKRSVYYNWRMRNGDWININQSVVRRTQWDVRRDDPTEALASL